MLSIFAAGHCFGERTKFRGETQRDFRECSHDIVRSEIPVVPVIAVISASARSIAIPRSLTHGQQDVTFNRKVPTIGRALDSVVDRCRDSFSHAHAWHGDEWGEANSHFARPHLCPRGSPVSSFRASHVTIDRRLRPKRPEVGLRMPTT